MAIILAVLSLIIAGLPFVQSGAVALLINALVAKRESSEISFLILLLIVASLVPDLFYSVKGYFDKKFWIVMQEKLELMFLEKKGAIDIATYENPKFNDLLNKAEARSIFPMLNLLDAQFSNLQNIVGVVVASSILIAVDPNIFFVIFIATIPKFFVEAKYGHGIWSIYDGNAEARRKFFSLRTHFYTFSDLIELKLFQNVTHFLTMLKALMRDFYIQQQQEEKKKLLAQTASIIISGVALGLATFWIVQHVTKGTTEIGTMVFALGAIASFQNALSGFFLSIAAQYQHSLFVTDTFKIMDTQPVIKQVPHPMILDGSIAPEIVFDHVTFMYPETETPILKDFSLTIKAGEKLALVGVNGAGKTTLVKLITRIYDPTEGSIFVNGHNLRDIDLDSWLHQIGVLFQDFATYHFIAKDVIAMGRAGEHVQLDEVKQAAHMSGADEFIERWDKQYDQMIGKEFTGGIDPSKGQLQKLALARSFYRNPRLLILDEPTASIDAEAEAKIFEKLESLPKDKTVILISHRFSTVRKADQICVIKDGRIEEIGTHAVLMKKEGTYARLFEMQASGYRTEE